MFSRFFIDRPIFATVISLVIVIAGLASMANLPVEQYPNLSPPTVSVRAIYPGASAEVIAETVSSLLEQKINGIEDMIYMNSVASSNGEAKTIVHFNVGSDPDKAMINVNNRAQLAVASLPEEVRRYGLTVAKESSSFLEVISLYSDDVRYNATYLGNYALLNIVDELKRLEGVGEVAIFGGEYSMRIWLKPDRLSKLELTVSDVVAAISEQNSQRSAGAVGKQPMDIKVDRSYVITTKGRYSSVEEFENIILRTNADGTALRLKDVADIELGAQSYDIITKMEGKDCVPIMISLSPGANSIATADRVEKALTEIAKSYPKGIGHKVVFETTGFVKNSIKEVLKTLLEAIFLVFLVILLFLKSLRATIIPCLAVPVSIIGAFAGMLALGFSINTLTLFGLVLAIGIVVDDAIIVIENVERIMRTHNLSVRDATIKAMDEVSGALVAIVLVLVAVFVPVAFMGGLSGTMYKQFAITIAVSVGISGLCALTLTPALCVVFLENHSATDENAKTNRFFAGFDRIFEKITDKYTSVVKFFLKNAKVGLLSIVVIASMSLWLLKTLPTSLVPEEDQGVLLSCAFLDPAASLDRSFDAMSTVASTIAKNPAVDGYTIIAGYNMLNSSIATNAATMFMILKDWGERRDPSQSAQSLAKQVFAAGFGVTSGIVFGICLPPIVGMSITGGFEGYIQKIGKADSQALQQKVQEFVAEASKRPELTGVTTTFHAGTPQLKMEVDELKALTMNVPLSQIYNTMASTFGAAYVNDFSKSGRGFKVMIQAKDKYRAHPDQINEFYVRSTTGAMIPLSAFVKLTPTVGPDNVERFNLMSAAKIFGNPAPGYTSGEALNAAEDVANKVLGSEYRLSWSGSSYQEKISNNSALIAILIGLVIVFLILAAQYEKWSLPFAVILAVPFALLGAVLAVMVRGFSNDIYFQIALITLMGLSAKNAILIIEFATTLRQEGESLISATIKSAQMRFRPIIMTSLAFILGCIPLAISTGAGAASRQSLGTGVVGGMIVATVLAPLFIPLLYMLISIVSENMRGKKGQ